MISTCIHFIKCMGISLLKSTLLSYAWRSKLVLNKFMSILFKKPQRNEQTSYQGHFLSTWIQIRHAVFTLTTRAPVFLPEAKGCHLLANRGVTPNGVHPLSATLSRTCLELLACLLALFPWEPEIEWYLGGGMSWQANGLWFVTNCNMEHAHFILSLSRSCSRLRYVTCHQCSLVI